MRINVSSLNLGTRQGCVKIEINSNPFYRNTSLRFKPPSDQRKARWTVKIVEPTNKMMMRKKRRWGYISSWWCEAIKRESYQYSTRNWYYWVWLGRFWLRSFSHIALMMISQLYQRNMFKCWEIQLAVQNQTSQSAKSSKFNICLPLISFKTIQSSCRGDYVLYLLEFNLLKSKQVQDWHIKKTDLSPTRYMKEIRQFKVHTHSNRNSCRGDYAGHVYCTFISFYLKSKKIVHNWHIKITDLNPTMVYDTLLTVSNFTYCV